MDHTPLLQFNSAILAEGRCCETTEASAVQTLFVWMDGKLRRCIYVMIHHFMREKTKHQEAPEQSKNLNPPVEFITAGPDLTLFALVNILPHSYVIKNRTPQSNRGLANSSLIENTVFFQEKLSAWASFLLQIT